MRRDLTTGLVVLAQLALVVASPAAVIRVPQDYPSVLAGVDAAVAGDSVLVGPGTWTDRETRTIVYLGVAMVFDVAMVLKPGVTVVGNAGAAATVVDGGPFVSHGVSTVVHAQAGDAPARIIGLTITGGGQGVTTGGSNAIELEGCHITRNQEQGVGARDGLVTLTDCVISENELGVDASNRSGAIAGFDFTLTCRGCLFERNAGPGIRVSGVERYDAVVLQDSDFRDHTSSAVWLTLIPAQIDHCRFLRNSASHSGGAVALDRCTGDLRFCAFAFDSSTTGGGGGAAIIRSGVHVENNTFFGCHAAFAGGAITVIETDVGVRNNIIAYSTGPRGAARKTLGPMDPTTGCNLFWANQHGDYYDDWTPAPTDLHADPLFCDPANLNFTVEGGSPAANGNWVGCGLIGAFGVGCNPVSVEPQTWGRLKSLFR